MPLNPKQARFVDEYLIDLNATQAAVRAGYSERTAHSQGPRLLEHVEVSAAIREAQAKRSERTKIDADWLLTRLAAEADADVSDLYDEDGNVKPIKQWPKIWRQGLISGMDVHRIVNSDNPEAEIVKLRISDRAKRLEMIGRHVSVQAFNDKSTIEIRDRSTILGKARERAKQSE